MAEQTQTTTVERDIAGAWTRFGGRLTPNAGVDQWKREAGLEWTVKPADVTVAGHIFPGRVGLVRSDTGKPLSIVSKKYKVVQPPEILEFFRGWADELGGFQMETAGALNGGKRIWALAKAVDAGSLDLGGGDVIDRYALLATSLDGTLPTIFTQTSIRVVCENTLAAAVREGKNDASAGAIIVPHRVRFDGDAVKERLKLMAEWTSFTTYIKRLADKKVAEADAEEFFFDVFYPKRDKDDVTDAQERRAERMFEYLDEAPGQDTPAAKGTAWGLVNAVTYYVDHEIRAKTAERRLDKAWFGHGADLKTRAFSRALELAGMN